MLSVCGKNWYGYLAVSGTLHIKSPYVAMTCPGRGRTSSKFGLKNRSGAGVDDKVILPDPTIANDGNYIK